MDENNPDQEHRWTWEQIEAYTYEIIHQRDMAPASLMTPSLAAAVQRSRDQVDVGINMPWAFYNLGIFHLLLGKPYDSLSTYAKAVQLSTSDWVVETSLRLLDKLSVVKEQLHGYEWIRMLLILGRAVKFHDQTSLATIKDSTTTNISPIPAPVIIVAGGTSVDVQLEEYRQLLLDGFQGFRGTIIGGGTTAGISGLVGTIQAAYPESTSSVGYIPANLPAGVHLDSRYRQVRSTKGKDFSALEPLQYWIDMISASIPPAKVKLIGINGGEIAAFEYRLALMLGAKVGVIDSSGREAAHLFKDPYWGNSENLQRLSADEKEIGTFIHSGT